MENVVSTKEHKRILLAHKKEDLLISVHVLGHTQQTASTAAIVFESFCQTPVRLVSRLVLNPKIVSSRNAPAVIVCYFTYMHFVSGEESIYQNYRNLLVPKQHFD